MKSVIIKVEGMMCEHCENRVNNALSQLDGLLSVKAEAKEKQVVCEYDDAKINIDTIKATIEDVGYDVIG